MADKKVPALCGLKSVPELTNPVIISDVHLAANKPKTIMAFLRFMKNVAPRFAELVILGDLFDYWLGDDATPEADPIIAELKLYSSTGRRVLIMQGSHDALLGADFAESCGAELIADQIVIPVNGNPILFAYGDQWCVRDQVRQARRRTARPDLAGKPPRPARPRARRRHRRGPEEVRHRKRGSEEPARLRRH